MSTMTPQDNARNNFPPSSSQNVFRVNTNTSNTSPAQQCSFGRPGMGVLRPLPQQVTYSGPYTSTPPTARSNLTATSAEQQIAQGVLSNNNTPGAPGTNTPQRCPPSNAPLGTSVHMPSISTPSQDQPINVNHTIHPSSTINQASGQRPAQGNLALQQHLNTQRSSISSASETVVGARPQERTDNETQDMSLIDPQLGVHHQIDPSPSIMTQSAPADSPPVVQGEMLSPPPGGSFPTFEALFAFAQAHALAHGYAFVIGRSKRDNRGLKKVFLICDRGGTNKEKVHGEQRQRKTKSRKCGCEFGVFGLENKTAWLLRGRIDGEHLMHNHPPSESPTEHPGARKLDPKAIAAVKALEENGVSVKETLEILHRENPLVRYLPRDIYNARAAIKRDPSRVEASAMEELPTFYKKPPMTFEEKLKAELRTEVANAQAEVEKTKEAWKKEVAELKEQLKQKDKIIQKFEMFIDICNERVMVQRERLAEAEAAGNGAGRS